jgi:hypothetical protein
MRAQQACSRWNRLEDGRLVAEMLTGFLAK